MADTMHMTPEEFATFTSEATEIQREFFSEGRWTNTYRVVYLKDDGTYWAVLKEETVGENSGGWEQEEFVLRPVRPETKTITTYVVEVSNG